MKNKLTVTDIDIIKSIDKIIFNVELELEYYQIGDIFLCGEGNYEFKLVGVSTETNFNQNKKSFLVKLNGEYDDINEFKNKEYYRKSMIEND
jgi:hypothetical protein